MTTRNIRSDEIHEYFKNKRTVYIHLIDREKGTDRDYPGIVDGIKNCPDYGFKVLVDIGSDNYWRPLNAVFVKDGE